MPPPLNLHYPFGGGVCPWSPPTVVGGVVGAGLSRVVTVPFEGDDNPRIRDINIWKNIITKI
jgi:hypothetical protein